MPKMTVNPEIGTADMSYHIATTILGKANLNFKTVLFGKTGSSKSNSMLFLAYNTARKVALFVDEDPDEWGFYFNYKKQIATIHPGSLLKLLRTKLPPGSVKCYDEIQRGANARKWRTKENDQFNEEFQIRRTERNAIFATLQDVDDQDRQSRNQYDSYINCGKGAKLFGMGYSFCKVQFGNLQGSSGATGGRRLWTNTPKYNGRRYKLFIAASPPDYILEFYDKLRETEEERWRKEEEKTENVEHVAKSPAAKNTLENQIVDYVTSKLTVGEHVNRTYVANQFNCSKQYVGQVWKLNNLDMLKVK